MARPITVEPLERTPRKLRSPRHPFQVRHKPYAICPFLIAPVLPGETLKGISMQSRAVSDPINSPLVGWHLEHYFFYVKFRDMESATSAALQDMMITPARSMTDIDDTATSTDWYHAGTAGNINFVKECVKVIVAWWFRNDGQAWDVVTIGNYPGAQIQHPTWMDGLRAIGTMDGVDFSVDLNADTTIKASEIEESRRRWEMLKLQGLTVQTYEEFLMTYGVSLPSAEVNRPELLRVIRNWQYPSNTVEPTTGVPTSAVSWSVSERADKDRYFKEPGFIVGLTVARPKLYLSNQVGSATALLNSVYSWLPATLRRDPETAWKTVDNANAIVSGQTTDYDIDMADLFLHGEQFVNFSLADASANLVALPNTGGGHQYPTEAMVDTLFADAAKELVRQDGIVNLQILGNVVEHYPFQAAGI